jgi:putative addiction module component (TIGR02574 family)
MSRDDRIALAQEIWDSIAAEETAPPMSEARCRELDRRIAEDDADPDGGIPWDEVESQRRARSAS